MVSNGMSNRRIVLKRPPVCISEGPKCGSCQLAANPVPDNGDGGFAFTLEIDLNCDPLPIVTTWLLYLAGGPTFDDPQQSIDVNNTLFAPCHAPVTPGPYLCAIIAINGSNCVNIFEFPIVVNP